jgi:hypothetical protein
VLSLVEELELSVCRHMVVRYDQLSFLWFMVYRCFAKVVKHGAEKQQSILHASCLSFRFCPTRTAKNKHAVSPSSRKEEVGEVGMIGEGNGPSARVCSICDVSRMDVRTDRQMERRGISTNAS